MEVLKMPNTNWSFKYTCQHCTAELQVEKSDIKHTHYPGNLRESSYDEFTSICVVCFSPFTIPNINLPKAVKFEIIGRKSLTTI